MSPAPVSGTSVRSALPWLVGVGLALLAPRLVHADGNPQGLARLQPALVAGQSEALSLTWTQGAEGEGTSRLVLSVQGDKARAQRCAPSCTEVGSPITLTSGEKGLIVSGLRALDLASLRSAEEAALADRTLELQVAGADVGRWQRARSDWPTPASGDGLQQTLDELLARIQRAAVARKPVPIPKTGAELAGLRLKFAVSPNKRPGGILLVEHGRVHVIPEEGSLARVPRPREFERPLSPEEESQILRTLQAVDWERIEEQVPRRALPAIGDEDGRLATLHLMRAEPEAAGSAAPSSAADRESQPRGLKRYVADLQRSSAEALIGQLLSLLVATPSEAGKAAAGAKGGVIRPAPGRAASR